jgi:hypothetical protein
MIHTSANGAKWSVVRTSTNCPCTNKACPGYGAPTVWSAFAVSVDGSVSERPTFTATTRRALRERLK